jgi:hypothetical protein
MMLEEGEGAVAAPLTLSWKAVVRPLKKGEISSN